MCGQRSTPPVHLSPIVTAVWRSFTSPSPVRRSYRAAARNLTSPSGAPVEIEVGEAAPEKSTANPATARDRVRRRISDHRPTRSTCGPMAVQRRIPDRPRRGVVIVDGEQDDRGLAVSRTGNESDRGAHRDPDRAHEGRARKIVRSSCIQTRRTRSGCSRKAGKRRRTSSSSRSCRAVCREFKELRFVKVAGHAGIPLNERTDQLVGEAIRRGR